MNIRKVVMNLKPYAWEESSVSIARRFGLPENEVVRFDMNTNPGILPAVTEASRNLAALQWNEYPPADYGDLAKAIGRYAGVAAGQVVVGAGGDEVIDLLAKAFLAQGDKTVISTPTYCMFRIAGESYGAKVTEVPRGPDFGLDVDALAVSAKDAKLLWVCNPNSPTGNAEPLFKIRALLESTKATVVVDEAYAEFGGESSVNLARDYDNLMVVRTLSKAFGLAGGRVGYAVTNEGLAAQLNKLRLPNSVSAPSAVLAEAALSETGIGQMRQGVLETIRERKRMARTLSRRLRVFASEANFLLVEFGKRDAQTVFQGLLEKGLVVRNLSQKPLTRNCLRITVRSPTQNNRLLEALA